MSKDSSVKLLDLTLIVFSLHKVINLVCNFMNIYAPVNVMPGSMNMNCSCDSDDDVVVYPQDSDVYSLTLTCILLPLLWDLGKQMTLTLVGIII